MNNKIEDMDDVADILNKIPNDFNLNWDEFYQNYPEINTMSFEEREKWKIFTRKAIYHFVNQLNIDGLCNKSYDIGYEEGIKNSNDRLEDVKDTIKEKIENILDEVLN